MKQNEETIAVPRAVIERRAKEMLHLRGLARDRRPARDNDLVTYAQVRAMIQNGVVDGLRQYENLVADRRHFSAWHRRFTRWVKSLFARPAPKTPSVP